MDENKKSEVAKQRERDEHGHFISDDPPEKPGAIASFFKRNTKVSKGHSDEKLIDLKVNNPLQKITELLEDTKQQKAFAFTLKGSLGIMGVVLSLSVLGIFGTTHMLCDKGTQTQLGVVRVLQATEEEEQLALWGKVKKAGAYFVHLFTDEPMPVEKVKQPVILFTGEKRAIQVLGLKEGQINEFSNQPVFATGRYDACVQRLQVDKSENVELSN